jgi:hypothetical protein
MYDVFLSYARSDRERAEQFQRAIRRCGWTVWWDADLLPGQKWNDVIEKELMAAGVVVVLWSEASVKSEFVRDEARIAREKDKLVPVTLDGQMPQVGMGQRQVENMSKWDGKDSEHPGLVKVLSGIRQILRTDPPPPPPPPEPIGVRTPTTPDKKKLTPTAYALVGAGLVVMIAVGVMAISYLPRGETPPDGTSRVPPSSHVEPTPGGGNGGNTTGKTGENAGKDENTGKKGGSTGPSDVIKSERPKVKPGGSVPLGPSETNAAKPVNPPVAPPLESTAAGGIAPIAAGPGCAALIAATRKQSDVASLFYDLGKCHYDEGRFGDAVRAYKSAVELNEQPKYYEGLGLAKWKNNQASQGIKDLTSAIELSKPKDPSLYSLLESRGQIYLASRNYQAAQDDYDKATQLNPKSKSGWLGLAAAAEKTMSLDIAASAKAQADALP